MSIKDCVLIARMPKGVLIGLVCKFSTMPIIGFYLATASGLPPGLAAGITLEIGCRASTGLAPTVFGPVMNVTGSSLAAWWRVKQPKVHNNNQHS